ncbi:glutamine--fructose-6-phosphate transaminase (isomerizing) [Ghiorsea bivora]|uniref:glutamine--fructose-6-phosphate transaminase (isomerizing) n=1 Tax=Ghiorsea bivora TaxID=1485545 RepID=UPI000571C25A|nr:glutamine--fructose-6-phosphate transaminase (isomerizing) [Ghiorsea bivora]
MCGIIGAVGLNNIQNILLQSLKSMEYRGYDSAGICIQHKQYLHTRKAKGKLINLEHLLEQSPLTGNLGIGHTRWATHGVPEVRNAHPHQTENIAIVHNGIIENHKQLRESLSAAGATFDSDTDSETIPWLWQQELTKHNNPEVAFHHTLNQLEGAFAIAGIQATDNKLWFARRGSPLLLAKGEAGIFVASDALAVGTVASHVMYLQEGQWGWSDLDHVHIFNEDGSQTSIQWEPMPEMVAATEKGPYAHYMLKEIHEQPRVFLDILHAYAPDKQNIHFPQAAFIENDPLPARIIMVACGTSYHAALTARYWLERYLKIPVEVDVASEFRYRDPVIGDNTWFISLSQSGETADTLEALRLFKRQTPQNKTLVFCNVASSSMVRESDGVIELYAGPEIGVASTKAYTAQLLALALFSLKLASDASSMPPEDTSKHIQHLFDASQGVESLLNNTPIFDKLTPLFSQSHGALFLGRGPCFPLALEGALKLKEISYLHAEGYPAGEMKHGPIALIDENLPVIVLALRQYHLDKVISNLHEVQARGAKVILITDIPEQEYPNDVDAIIHIPEGDFFSAPLLASIPLQYLAYNVARFKGTDVDQPRNLAKSVTVE